MFYRRTSWTTDTALKIYHGLAEVYPDDRLKRYNWNRGEGFSEAEVDAIYAEVIAKIPAEATRVLEIGSAGGQFAEALRAARPGLDYRGVDLIMENVESAQALAPDEEFVVGNALEYLMEATEDWDFVVSIHCLFSCTDTRHKETLFRVLNAKSSKGFLVVGDVGQMGGLDTLMTDAITESTNVTESYVSGARDFLTDATLKDTLSPLLVVRDSTPATVPTKIPVRLCPIATGNYNRVVARSITKMEMHKGNPVPEDFPGIDSTGGLVTSTRVTKTVESTWVNKLKVKPKSVIATTPEE